MLNIDILQNQTSQIPIPLRNKHLTHTILALSLHDTRPSHTHLLPTTHTPIPSWLRTSLPNSFLFTLQPLSQSLPISSHNRRQLIGVIQLTTHFSAPTPCFPYSKFLTYMIILSSSVCSWGLNGFSNLLFFFFSGLVAVGSSRASSCCCEDFLRWRKLKRDEEEEAFWVSWGGAMVD